MALKWLELIVGIVSLTMGIWGLFFNKRIAKVEVLAIGGSMSVSRVLTYVEAIIFITAGLILLWRAFI